ncbi:AAA family ATPase [Roseomonas sp. JC162]|uniref:AAA family ATPase n=1 Tax=Neoroseomonas marina TaxID=1232220 RepID=A0A848ECN8_9PROT|nr:AAA family ATPase [Neoroseomonas marina]NMJ41213.1 AAA family ATPase [Neoroseomonas marina]
MADPERDFIVFTGGPGAGKTTLVEHLAREGLACCPEAGRGIIRAQAAIDGPALPWRDQALFGELMLGWEMRSHEAARLRPRPVLFDRGVPDVIGYLRLEGLPVPGHLLRAAERLRYRRQVFVAPPWPEIYRQDMERRQDADTARRTCDAMRETYGSLGYDLIDLPLAPVEERAAFVRDALGLSP